jgi:heme/copper-type cytochrome/quinol oxidase subunit 4
MVAEEQPTPSAERLWVSIAWYAALIAVTIGYLTHNFRLAKADLSAPLCTQRNDSAALLSLITVIHESGSPWRADRLGAPGTAERFDYPLPEHAHYLALRGLLRLTNDPFLAFNLWALFSYPLTAVCAFAVLRALGLSRPVAFALAVVYTFLPYHASRVFAHTMLAYYHTVPLIVLPAAWIVVGHLPFFAALNEVGRRRVSLANARTIWTLVLLAIVAVTSPYYAFFGCFFLLVAGLYRGLSEQSWRPLWAGCGAAAFTIAIGFACTLPFVLEQREHGSNPAVAQRHPNEADVYCLKVTELVLPLSQHRIRPLGHITRLYNSESAIVNENRDSVLGFVGTLGFFLLIGRLLVARGGPTLLGGLAVLNVAAIVLGSSGGLGGLFNYLVFPQMRCYNRVCVFIAFWSLLAIGLVVDRWAARGHGRRTWLAALALVTLGVADVTNEQQAPRHAELRADHQSWREFGARMEEALPAGGMVFQLPATSYPEVGPVYQMPDYSHLTSHVYTQTLRWSFGTDRNRRWADWHEYVANLPTVDFIRALVLADFSGVYIDRRGYADHGNTIVAELRTALGPEVVTSKSGDQMLFTLASVSQSIRSGVEPAAWERDRLRLLNRPCVLCQDGFLRHSPTMPPEPWHATYRATMRLVNPGNEVRRVTLHMDWRRQGPNDREVTVTGSSLGIEQQFIATGTSQPFNLDVDLPPGEHVVTFDTSPKPFGFARMHVAWNGTDVRLIERDGR